MVIVKEKEIDLNGYRVVYCLKTSARARNLRISIKPGGAVTATRSRFISEKAVEDFLVKKSSWILDKINELKNRRGLLPAGTKEDFKKLAPAARSLVLEKIARFVPIYQVNYNRIAIRDQSSRWGSCSYKKNLNFNYRIALLPERLADYIVAHELCHLRELNHSPRFWNLVAQTIPDYPARRRELRRDYC
jgi:hypothetical protein